MFGLLQLRRRVRFLLRVLEELDARITELEAQAPSSYQDAGHLRNG